MKKIYLFWSILPSLSGPMISSSDFHPAVPGFSVSTDTVKYEKKYTKEELTEDARELLNYLEYMHPDPYYYSGGKVEFHRKIQSVLQNIPADGMGKNEFTVLIRPFIASISDGHTRIASGLYYDCIRTR